MPFSPAPATPVVTEEYIHRTQNVYVSVSSASQGADLYGFDANQREALDELMRPENVAFLLEMTGGTAPSPMLPQEEYTRLKAALDGLNPDRQGLVEAALSLVGKVNYFWGGKSSAIGPDERWGTPMKVTAAGSKSTGTTRPFGLDCSGFAAWTYHQIGVHPDILGWGSRAQWERSRAVSWEEARPGDLVFFAVPGTSAQHVGFIVGFDEEGRPLAAHCNSTHNNVTVDDAKSVGFRYVRRTLVFEDDIGEMNG